MRVGQEENMAILEVNCLEKIYKTRLGGNQVQALWDVSFSVEQGEYLAIMGESGSTRPANERQCSFRWM